MNFKKTLLYIVAFATLVIIHYFIWETYVNDHEETFRNYYFFLGALYITALLVLLVGEKFYPGYIGFIFMGLLLFKLMIMFVVMQKLNLSEVPNSRTHFIVPYLLSLLLETLFAVKLIKDEKNQ